MIKACRVPGVFRQGNSPAFPRQPPPGSGIRQAAKWLADAADAAAQSPSATAKVGEVDVTVLEVCEDLLLPGSPGVASHTRGVRGLLKGGGLRPYGPGLWTFVWPLGSRNQAAKPCEACLSIFASDASVLVCALVEGLLDVSSSLCSKSS